MTYPNLSKALGRFRIAGTVTAIKEFVSVSSGKKSLQVIISDGSTAYRADIYEEGLYLEASRLIGHPPFNAIITGRLSGKCNDKGFFNYSLFADELVQAYPHKAPAPAHSQPTPHPTMADADIPF